MILVIGATGNNGSEIVKQLSEAGHAVRALVRHPAKAEALPGEGVEIVQGDLAQPATLDAALEGIDRIMLISAYAPNQVELQGNLIEAAQRAGAPHLVKFSALGADPDSSTSILRWHGQTERQIENSGLPFTFLRPNSFMQNMLAFAQGIAAQGAFYLPADDANVSHVDVRDIAAVAVQVLAGAGHEGKSYEITGPESLTFSDIAATLSDVVGQQVNYVNVAPQDFKQSMLGYGLPEWMVDGMNELYEYYRDGNGGAVTSTVADVTGKQPISFDQFARDNAGAFKGQGT